MATKTKRKDKPVRIEPTDWEEVAKRAGEIYDSIKKELEKEHRGKTCAVDGKSGDYQKLRSCGRHFPPSPAPPMRGGEFPPPSQQQKKPYFGEKSRPSPPA